MSTPSIPSMTVLGSINLDLVRRVPELPAPGETTLTIEEQRFLGGKGANQAAAGSRLGATVRMVGAIGADAAGDFARQSLIDAGVDTHHVARLGAETGSAWIAVDRHGENQIIVSPGANTLLSPETPVPDSDVLLCQLEIDPAVVEQAIARAKGFVAINAAPALHLSEATLLRADLVVVNQLEWKALPELAICRSLIVTDGAEGATLYRHGHKQLRVPATAATVLSTVGAGDAFVAAATIGFASGVDPRRALEAAAAVGAHAVSRAESQPPLGRYDTYLAEAGGPRTDSDRSAQGGRMKATSNEVMRSL